MHKPTCMHFSSKKKEKKQITALSFVLSSVNDVLVGVYDQMIGLPMKALLVRFCLFVCISYFVDVSLIDGDNRIN